MTVRTSAWLVALAVVAACGADDGPVPRTAPDDGASNGVAVPERSQRSEPVRGDTAPRRNPGSVRRDTVLGPFPVGPSGGPQDLWVELEVLVLPGREDDFGRTVVGLSIRAGEGSTVHRADYEVPAVSEYGFEFTLDVYPWVLEYGGGRILQLAACYLPSAPGSGCRLQHFHWADGRLEPLSEPFVARGSGDLPAGSIARSSRLLEGDILPFEHWTGYFGAWIPLEVRPTSEQPFRLAAEADPETGLTALTIEARPGAAREGPVTLFAGPVGPESRRVTVEPGSAISYGPAWVRFGEPEDGIPDLEPALVRLHVTIDGRDGYVEERDFATLGLRPAG